MDDAAIQYRAARKRWHVMVVLWWNVGKAEKDATYHLLADLWRRLTDDERREIGVWAADEFHRVEQRRTLPA